jgi:hypothetical protein
MAEWMEDHEKNGGSHEAVPVGDGGVGCEVVMVQDEAIRRGMRLIGRPGFSHVASVVRGGLRSGEQPEDELQLGAAQTEVAMFVVGAVAVALVCTALFAAAALGFRPSTWLRAEEEKGRFAERVGDIFSRWQREDKQVQARLKRYCNPTEVEG